MFLSLGIFFVYAPLFLTAFVLSIVGLTKGRVAAGLGLLLVTTVVPTVSWFGIAAFDVGLAAVAIVDEL